MILISAAFISSIFMSWTVGAVSAPSSFGPVVSSRAMGILRSTLVVGISAFLGAFFQGQRVTNTLSSGFVNGVSLGPNQAVLILMVSATMVAMGVWLHLPIPTAFTLVGATIGAGLGMGGSLDLTQISTLFSYWLVLPLVAGTIGYLTSALLRAYVPKNDGSKTYLQAILICVGIYTAFTAGATQVGLAIGPLVNAVNLPLKWLLALGGFGIIVGAWTGSPNIIHAVARDYADLGLRRSIAALVGTSLLAQGASLIGIPISFNAAILGAVVGSGLIAQEADIGTEKIKSTILSWFLTFFFSFGVVFSLQHFLF